MTNDLRELVTMRLAELGSPERPLSYRAAAARSSGRVSHGTIGRIARGDHAGLLTGETIDGLALALGVHPTVVEQAAGMYRERPLEPFHMPARADRLTRRERGVILAMVDALLAAAEQGHSMEPAAATGLPPQKYATPDIYAAAGSSAQDAYDLVAYSADGSGSLSKADMETIRRHEEEEEKRRRQDEDVDED
ncbi:hypothetical protein [Streptomyces sp. BA2]|uniref:hypothetical protein n=1 Tax=Streptomyces sp. BA2 TaxID=436595 RepID=UPI00132B1CBD|nr:hypothetical protein [Streptomyces sp. BA2]MWA07857.1 hypothetical protein [Streptomyces sp. BA2]